jgi:hypothetical protein
VRARADRADRADRVGGDLQAGQDGVLSHAEVVAKHPPNRYCP